jgi:hypothetical protein
MSKSRCIGLLDGHQSGQSDTANRLGVSGGDRSSSQFRMAGRVNPMSLRDAESANKAARAALLAEPLSRHIASQGAGEMGINVGPHGRGRSPAPGTRTITAGASADRAIDPSTCRRRSHASTSIDGHRSRAAICRRAARPAAGRSRGPLGAQWRARRRRHPRG